MKVVKTTPGGFPYRFYVNPANRRERLALYLRGYRASYGMFGAFGWMNHERYKRK